MSESADLARARALLAEPRVLDDAIARLWLSRGTLIATAVERGRQRLIPSPVDGQRVRFDPENDRHLRLLAPLVPQPEPQPQGGPVKKTTPNDKKQSTRGIAPGAAPRASVQPPSLDDHLRGIQSGLSLMQQNLNILHGAFTECLDALAYQETRVLPYVDTVKKLNELARNAEHLANVLVGQHVVPHAQGLVDILQRQRIQRANEVQLLDAMLNEPGAATSTPVPPSSFRPLAPVTS